jgi:hypothetical protein
MRVDDNSQFLRFGSAHRSRGISDALSAVKAPQNGRVLYANTARDLGHVQCFALPFKVAAHPAVAGLLPSTRPSDIARFVIPIIVDAVKRKPGRAGSYIRKEGLERSHPPVANGDATPAIRRVAGRPRVQAPVLHVGPNGVLGRGVHTVSATHTYGEPVRRQPLGSKFFGETTATATIAPSQATPADNANRAALATAFKTPGFSLSRGFCDDRPASELLSCFHSSLLERGSSCVNGGM